MTNRLATISIGRQMAALRRMTPKQLREKYEDVFANARDRATSSS